MHAFKLGDEDVGATRLHAEAVKQLTHATSVGVAHHKSVALPVGAHALSRVVSARAKLLSRQRVAVAVVAHKERILSARTAPAVEPARRDTCHEHVASHIGAHAQC